MNFLNKASNAFAYDGDVSAPFSSDSDHSAICKSEGADNLSAIWRTDDFGCKYAFDKPRSPDDRKAEKMLHECVEHDGTRWVAPLLRRDEDEQFPESRTMAEKRTISLEKRLDKSRQKKNCKTPNLAEMVYEKMEKMISDGHFRKLSSKRRVCGAAQEHLVYSASGCPKHEEASQSAISLGRGSKESWQESE